MRLFGQIPKGALLFILEKDGQEPEKYRGDGIGNASHIGIKTGRNDGAIHSSSSRGCVATSKFKDKTIPNGGWNRIGLLSYFSYDKSINWYFDHTAIGEKPAENNKEEQTMVDAIIKSKNGGKVNLRAGKSKKSDRIAEIPSESKVQFIEGAEGWSKIQWEGKTGWVMSEFVYGEDDLPAEDPNDFEPVNDGTDQSGSEKVTLTFTVEELAFMLPILQSMTDQIISKVGRG
jgi:hypothetical protein